MTGLELTASALMPVNAWLVARRSMWNWPVGVATVALLLFVFLDARLYAATGLQALFLILNVYGWWAWSRHRDGDPDAALPLVRLNGRDRVATAVGVVAATAAIALLLARATDAVQPWWDSANTALALAAQWWQARRAVDCWPLWIAVNIGSAALYATQGLWAAAASYAVLLVVAAWGWFEWNRAWRAQP